MDKNLFPMSSELSGVSGVSQFLAVLNHCAAVIDEKMTRTKEISSAYK